VSDKEKNARGGGGIPCRTRGSLTIRDNFPWVAFWSAETLADVKPIAWSEINVFKQRNRTRDAQVVLGGGRRHFVPKVATDPEEPDKEGRRLDGRNLIKEWSRNHRLKKISAEYVANKEQFENVDPRKVERLLGE